ERHRKRKLLPAPQRLRLDGPAHNIKSRLADILPRRGHPLDVHADGLDLAKRDAGAAWRGVADLQRDGVMPGREGARHRDAQLATAGLTGADLVEERAAVQPDERRALADSYRHAGCRLATGVGKGHGQLELIPAPQGGRVGRPAIDAESGCGAVLLR